MKESRDCNIVQDLLPNYIEELTKEETNQFVSEHLKECRECSNVLENMEKDLKLEKGKNTEKEVKYIKKFSQKLKKLKVILFIFLVLTLVFLCLTARKMIIIKDINEKASKYINSDNFYEKIINNSGRTITVTEHYSKADKAVLFVNTTFKDNNDIRKLSNYFDGERTNTYIESNEDKIALLDSNGVPSKIMIIGIDYNNDLWTLFQMAAVTSIKNGEHNGKECYILSSGGAQEVYIEKQTGLRIKAKEGTWIDQNGNEVPTIVEYFYEFGKVEDSIFIEPDINQYKIQEKE